MYGALQTTSGNENVGFPFLCQSTYKRRTVFSFPPIVSCHVRVLTMMCLSTACLISEFPPSATFCTPCKLPFTRGMLYQACYYFAHDLHAFFKIFIISVFQTPSWVAFAVCCYMIAIFMLLLCDSSLLCTSGNGVRHLGSHCICTLTRRFGN
jgi:hypothetical protein